MLVLGQIIHIDQGIPLPLRPPCLSGPKSALRMVSSRSKHVPTLYVSSGPVVQHEDPQTVNSYLLNDLPSTKQTA